MFTSSDSHNGGFKFVLGSGTGNPLTSVVGFSAAVHVLPNFFLFEGVHTMNRSFDPLSADIFKDDSEQAEWYAQPGWIPR